MVRTRSPVRSWTLAHIKITPSKGLFLCVNAENNKCCFRPGSKTAAMLQASEVGSRTLSRFEVEDEQIYLVISDRSWTLAQKDKTLS